MKAECINAVGRALGRSVTQAEVRGLERRLADAFKREAVKDPQAWQGLSQGDRLQLAAASAAKELIEEAQTKRLRVAKTIIAHDRMRNFVRSQLAAGFDADGFDALSRMIAARPDGKNNIQGAEEIAHGIESQALGDLFDTWETVHSQFSDLIAGALGKESQSAVEGLLIRALHGENVGRPEVMKAAKAFQDVAEKLRQRFNAAGGEIGKLDNWGFPHAWSADLVAEAGAQKFIDALMPLVDRRQYVHVDGKAFTDSEMQAFLEKAWYSITTNGANKPLSEQRQPGMRAKRHAESRQIHFKDGDSAHKALSQFSEVSVLQAIAGHVRRMSRDIALVEQFGPNPDLAVAKILDELNGEFRLAKPGKAAQSGADRRQRSVENLYDYLSGSMEMPSQVPLIKAFGWESKYTVGELFQDLRNLAVASKLGSAFIPSIVDEATMHLTASVNGIPHVRLFLNELNTLNPLDRTEARIAGRMGLLTHTMLDDLNRWGTSTLGVRKTSKIASTVVRASGLNAITEARRRAFAITMMDTLGALTREHKTIADLEKTDVEFLKRTGITEETWKVWRLAQPDKWRGNDTLLNAQSIYRIPDGVILREFGKVNPKWIKDQAATALLGFVRREQDTAVITPGAREHSMMNAGVRPGTWKGELLRTFFLFKSFPIAMIGRHLGRTFNSNLPTGQRIVYGTALLASTTILGAIAVEIGDMLNGRDPRSMNPANRRGVGNIMAGLLKGGALGIYGDLLFANPSNYGQSYLSYLLGPVAGTVEGAGQLTLGNMNQLARGETTDAGAELVRFARTQTPFANLWYTKAVTDHLIFQKLQEHFSPGYLRKMKARAQKDFGSSYWWEPGQTAPKRAPDLEKAVAGGH